MRKFLIRPARAAAIVCCLASMTTAAVSDTITAAMSTAYTNSNLLEQNRFLLRIQDEGVAQAISQLRPVLSFVASTSRDFVGNSTTSTASLVAEFLLLDGGGRARALDAAEETVLAARDQLVGLEQQVLLDAAIAYLNVWRDLQVVQATQRSVQTLTVQLRAARDRFELGESTRTDVAQAEAQLAQARSSLASAEGSLTISRELFNLAVGQYPDGISGPGALPSLPRTVEAAQNLARQEHPSIRALQHEVAAADFTVEQARAAYRPRVGIEGRINETFSSPNPILEGGSGSLAITLTQPIYQGGQLFSLERQARAQASSVRSALNQQVLINLQAVGNAWASLTIANAQIQAANQQISAAQLAFDGVSEEARLGARTTIDVLDAEQDLLDAQIARIQAQTDLYIASYTLLNASGLLTVSNLGLDVPEYDPAAYADLFSNAPARVQSVQGDQLDSLLERFNR